MCLYLTTCLLGCGSTVVKIKAVPIVPPVSLLEEVTVPVADVKRNRDLVDLVIELYKGLWKANGRIAAIRKYIEDMEGRNE